MMNETRVTGISKEGVNRRSVSMDKMRGGGGMKRTKMEREVRKKNVKEKKKLQCVFERERQLQPK